MGDRICLNLVKQLGSGRETAFQGCPGIMGVIDQLELEKGGAPDQLFGSLGIGNAGLLNQDIFFPLTTDDRFGHGDFVDAVSNRRIRRERTGHLS